MLETVGQKINRLVEDINKSSHFHRAFIAEQVLIEVCKIPDNERPNTIKIDEEIVQRIYQRNVKA
jgi:hypothetical protein